MCGAADWHDEESKMTKHAAALLDMVQTGPVAPVGAATDRLHISPDGGVVARFSSLPKMVAVWALAMLVALPSMGSRLEDATLTDARQNAVRAALDPQNPIWRNAGILVSAVTYGVHGETSARKEPHDVDLSALIAVARKSAIATLRPPPRPATLSSAVLKETPAQVSLSTSGAVAAPIALALPYAPVTSLRPVARPKGMERRMVQYSARWLRDIPARNLSEQEQCLAVAIYHEARGEGIKGQFAVAEVVLNRVASRKFPGSICGVVFQGVKPGRFGGCQFSFACDDIPDTMPNKRAADLARRIAQVMLDGGHRGLTGGATYFHTVAVNPSWAKRFSNTAQIGAHLFYRG